VEIAAGTNSSGMFLDSFELTESGGTIYYQPEESLDLLKGERSIGDWESRDLGQPEPVCRPGC
jgi:hypothetical protein